MNINDYLPCEAYSNQPKHPKQKNFTAFFHEASNRYFFGLLDEKGTVVLKSEGYPQEKSRENGLASVVKNLKIREHFSVKEEDGQFFVSLRAGNHQEIARSCGFATKAAAETHIAIIFGEKKAEIAPKSADTPKVAAVKSTTTKVEKTTSKVEKPVAKSEKVEVKVVTPTKAIEKKTTIPAPEVKGVAHYLSIDAYFGHDRLVDEVYGVTGYAVFQGPDARHYFSVYNPDGSIFLRSAGFDSAELREKTLNNVKSNILLADKYRVREEKDGFAVVLVDEKDKEIARSGYFESFTKAFSNTPSAWEKVTDTSVY